MEGPGLSIFQGDSIKIDTSLNRLEEDEALEDQKRRDEELGNQLENAFDDLIGDDDCTADSSAHFQTNADPIQYLSGSNPAFGPNSQKQKHCKEIKIDEDVYNSIIKEVERLRKALESRTRENENISKMMQEEKKNNEELRKRLALAEAEGCRASMTYKQTHELLVESKTKISDLEDTISKLKGKIKTLESTNNELVADLERVQTLLSDSQHKYMMVERNVGLNSNKHAEVLIKQSNERHKAQIDMMTQQIDSLRGKLDDKETELRILDTRYKELQRSRECLLVDKAETINQLAQSLESSQKQVQELMSKQDSTQENIRLQHLVTALENQTANMQKTIQNLTSRLDSSKLELDLMNSIFSENAEEHGSSRRLSFTKANVIGSTPIIETDRLARLKNELYRSMASQKSKREEIRKLQEQLDCKNEEIKRLKDEENAALVQITTYKEENIRLQNKLHILKGETKEVSGNKREINMEKSICDSLKQEIDKLNKENELLKQQLKNVQDEYAILKENEESFKTEIAHLRIKLNSSEDVVDKQQKLTSQLKYSNIDLEEFKKENESLKSNNEILLKENESVKLELERQKFLFQDAQNECDRFKNLYVEISNAKEVLSIELANLKGSDLYRQLHAEKHRSINLERALQLNELKLTEFEKLLKKEKTSHEEEVKQLKEKVEKEKAETLKSTNNFSSTCAKCIEYVAENTKLEIQTLKLEDQCSIYTKELAEIRKKFDEANQRVNDLKEKLLLKDERDKLITDLKMKAQQFEEYIKCQENSNTTSGVSSPRHIESRDQSVETSPDLELNYTRRVIEARIRDEMAKIFAVEIKNIEERFKLNLQELESQNSALKQDLKNINSDLKSRQNEVQILKHAILSEREKMEEIIKRKDLDAQQLFQQQKVMLQKCRDELQAKHNKVADLIRELDDRNTQIEAERQSMKAVMNQWEDQRKITDLNEEELKRIVNELKKEHANTVEQLQAKYNSAKKTAANYKRYAEEKEKHMMQEYERIKLGYDISLKKVENRMREALEKHDKEAKQRIQEIKMSYEEKTHNYKKGTGP